MMKEIFDLESEIKKAESPYEYYTDEAEDFRGQKEDKGLIRDFLSKFRMFKDEDAITDPDTMMRFAKYASEGSYDMLYCDDDVLKNGTRTDPFFKPEYAPENLESYGMFFGMCAVRSYIDIDSDNWYKRLDPQRVKHIPEVLSHYMDKRPEIKPAEDVRVPGNFDLGRRSLSIIILSKDHPGLLEKCVQSLARAELPEDTELIVVDNGSTPENRTLYRKILRPFNADYVCRSTEFNYSFLNNEGERRATGDFLLFLNDDVEIPEESRDFIKKLLFYSSRRHAGAVGMKLLYPESGKIQHCGITLLKSGPSHKLSGYPDEESMYFGVNRRNINVLAVTGACLCIKRRLFEEAGGFDENLPVAYNDVDLCVRLYELGYYNICINDTFLYHYESASRKDDRTDLESYLRMKDHRSYFYERHRNTLFNGDPFYHRSLTKTRLTYDVDVPFYWEISGVKDDPLFRNSGEYEPVRVRKGLRYNIDSARYRLSDAYLNEDFFEVFGWIFLEGKNMNKYEPGIMISHGTKSVIYAADRSYRKDVKDVFPKQKKACMAGFYTRISHNSLVREDLNGNINVAPVLISKGRKVYIGE